MTKTGKDNSPKGLCIAAIYGESTFDNKCIFLRRGMMQMPLSIGKEAHPL